MYYLKGMLAKLGFNEVWVWWMAMCMETISYSIMVNDEKVGPITPGRGLRQDDPLSLYLFIICAEGLATLTHLLFTDDCFLFCRTNEKESRKLKEILNIYEQAYGQAINLQKS